MDVYLGIDTSAYTTSVALVDQFGNCLADERRLLSVKSGDRGLRQSDAFFQHVNALPACLKSALAAVNEPELKGIAVSAIPRDQKDSYMPVFFAGLRFAEVLADTLKIPLLKTTHQDGHIMAGCHSHPDLLKKPFLVVHLSGGTTEILSCQYEGNGFKAHLLGGTLDISFGQLIDRIGVHMGLPFPAGKDLEALILSENALKPAIFPAVKSSNPWFNLSGYENKAYDLLNTGESKANVAAGLIDSLAETLLKSVQSIQNVKSDQPFDPENGVEDILIIGGVASNLRLRALLTSGFEHSHRPLKVRYASVAASSDNALGVAMLSFMNCFLS